MINERKKEEAEKLKSELLVVGHVLSKNTGSSEEGYKFIITGGDTGKLSMVTLRMYSLPSACPWIQYSLVIKKFPEGSLYQILRIVDCSYRPIERKEIKTILSSRRRRSEKGGLEELTEPEKVDIYLEKFIRKLPQVIKSIKDVNGIKKVSKKKPDWFKKKALSLCEEIKELVRPCFRGPIFLSLLKFFDATILVKLSNVKLRAVYALVCLKPHLFCFWEQAMFVLAKLTIDGKKIFRSLVDDGFNLDVGYVSNEKIYESLISDEITNGTYSSKFPVWSIARLAIATKSLGINPPVPLQTIKSALQLYLEVERNSFLYGNTRFSLKQKSFIPLNNNGAVEFLVSNGILKWALGDYGGRTELIKPMTERAELRLARLLQDKIREVTVVDCPCYNAIYTNRLSTWINDISTKENIGMDGMLLLSANVVTAAYLTNSIGFTFTSLDDYDKISKHIQNGEISYIIIDRFHKVTLLQLVRLLEKIQVKSKDKNGVTEIRKSVHLHVFGDKEDFRSHFRRGLGDLMATFTMIPNPKVSVANWPWELDDKMYSLYANLKSENGINSAKVMFVPIDKTFVDQLKNVDVTTGKKKKKNEYHIFCSNKDNKKYIMDQIYKKRMNMPPTYDERIFYLGQKIQILEWDVIGKLEQIWSIDNRGNRYQVTGSRNPVNISFGSHIFIVGGIEYDTRTNHIEHADVVVISKFSGAPAETGMFIVGPTTSQKDLFCASKYCLEDMKVYTMEDANINNIKSGSNLPTSTDILNKLKLVKFK